MRRFSGILLILATAALGSGALRYVHELAHTAAAAGVHTGHGEVTQHVAHHLPDGPEFPDLAAPAPHPHDSERHDHGHGPLPHDPADCFTHAQLNLPMVQAGYVPLLVCLGLFVAFLTSLPAPVFSRRPVLRLDCRGPPAPSSPFG